MSTALQNKLTASSWATACFAISNITSFTLGSFLHLNICSSETLCWKKKHKHQIIGYTTAHFEVISCVPS